MLDVLMATRAPRRAADAAHSAGATLDDVDNDDDLNDVVGNNNNGNNDNNNDDDAHLRNAGSTPTKPLTTKSTNKGDALDSI